MPAYLVLVCLLVAPLLSHAAIYKWTDKAGNIHYSQTKPRTAVNTIDKIKVSHQHAPADRSTYKRPGSKTNKDQLKKDQAENKLADKKQKKLSPQKRKKYCASAKRNLATLRAKAQIKQRDKKGNIRFITDKEKQARIKQARRFMKKHCR